MNGPLARRLSADYRVGGHFRRVYHFHVRKTAGTSLNSAFWGLAGLDLSTMAADRVVAGEYVFVRHNRRLIEEGDYFFANSHFPAHSLVLPPETFTVTVLRDPLRRLVSRYRHLCWARDDPSAARLEPALRNLRQEGRWLGENFPDFLDRLPRAHLLGQLSMFSESYDVDEAIDRVRSCDAVFTTERFADGIGALSKTLGLDLEVREERRFGEAIALTKQEEDHARDLLAPEYVMMNLLFKGTDNASGVTFDDIV